MFYNNVAELYTVFHVCVLQKTCTNICECLYMRFSKTLFISGVWGSVVVKALRYKSDGPGIDPWWCHLGFFPWFLPTKPCALRSTRIWKWVPGISPGLKAAGVFGWRPTTLVVSKVEKIRGLNLPGTPWATSACRGITLLYFILYQPIDCNNQVRFIRKDQKMYLNVLMYVY